jgi:hypothetical protein
VLETHVLHHQSVHLVGELLDLSVALRVLASALVTWALVRFLSWRGHGLGPHHIHEGECEARATLRTLRIDGRRTDVVEAHEQIL